MLASLNRPWATALTSGDWSLARVVVLYAVGLIVYLPLESGLISPAPPPLYWALRLLPDAVIGALAIGVVAFKDRPARTLPVRILWVVGGVAAIVIAANAFRSISPMDSINAIRVLVRYLALGLLLWWAIAYGGGPSARDVAQLVAAAILAIGAIEIVLVAIQIASSLLSGALARTPPVLAVEGSLGRYDRLGLLLMVVAITALGTTLRLDRWRLAILGASLFVLYLSTSRQAMVGLAAGAMIVALLPNAPALRRGLGAMTAVVVLCLILVTPSRLPSAGAGDPDGPAPAQPAVTPTPPPAALVTKGSTQFTTDPNKNFRMFYNLELAPWALLTEPIYGFGPGRQTAEVTDPRLEARVEAAGIPWQWARNFMNDSNYASLAIQFGAIVPSLFLLLIATAVLAAVRLARRGHELVSTLAVGIAAAVLVAAMFGPAFEIRPLSIIFWIALMVGLAARGSTVRTDTLT